MLKNARNRRRERGKLPRLDVRTCIRMSRYTVALLHTRHTWSGLCRMHRNRVASLSGLSHSWATVQWLTSHFSARRGSLAWRRRAWNFLPRAKKRARCTGIKDASRTTRKCCLLPWTFATCLRRVYVNRPGWSTVGLTVLAFELTDWIGDWIESSRRDVDEFEAFLADNR